MKNKIATVSKGSVFAAIIVVLALLCGMMTFIPVSARADGDDTEPAETARRVLYYVDAGNMADSSGNHYAGRGEINGVISSNTTAYMTANGLEFGNGTAGLYNAYCDMPYAEDDKTHKSWGFTCDASDYSWNRWRFWETSSTNETQDGFKTSRHVNESNSHEGILTYKFEVDDATTGLSITIGVRAYDTWGDSTYPVSVNGMSGNVTAKSKSDTERNYIAYGAEEEVGGETKYFVTIDFGGSTTTASAYVSWILIREATEEELEAPTPIGQSVFVRKGDTALKDIVIGGETVDVTLGEDALEIINAADYLEEVEIVATYDENRYQFGSVTVLPKDIYYFVNLGSTVDGEDFMTNWNAKYSAANGHGETSAESDRTPGWSEDFYYKSCLYGNKNTTLSYRMDGLANGTYSVTVGTYGHWNVGGRTQTISANDGTDVSLVGKSNESVTATCTGTVTDGTLTVKVVSKNNDNNAYLATFIMVYTEDCIVSSVAATEANCLHGGNPAYFVCKGCNTYYTDAAGTTEADEEPTFTPKLDHNPRKVNAVAATCESEGNEEHYTCDMCKKYFSNEHCDYELESVSIAALGHDYDNPAPERIVWDWSGDKSSATAEIKCSRGDSHDTLAVTEVTVSEETIKQPGCTQPGSKTVTAKFKYGVRTFSDVQTAEIPALGGSHNLVHHAAVTQDCEHGGNPEYYECTNCNHKYTTEAGTAEADEELFTEALGHSIEAVARTAPTCTEAGVRAHYGCARCDKLFSDAKGATETSASALAIDPLEHMYAEKVEATPATCESAATVAHYACPDCGKNFSDETLENELQSIAVGAATGHDYDYAAASVNWNWNGVSIETATIKCKNDPTHTVTEQVTVTSTVTKAATADAEGEKVYTATFTHDGTTYTSTRVEKLDKLTAAKPEGCGSVTEGEMLAAALALMAAAAATAISRLVSKGTKRWSKE